jgi:hypothetical protein
MNEIWEDIKGCEGLYQVSDKGRVKSFWYGRTKILKLRTLGNYFGVSLRNGASKKNKTIHRLVAETFLKNENSYPCINHKDENKSNNNATNLEWCTYSYNNGYGTKPIIQTLKVGKSINQYSKNGTRIKTWDSILSVEKICGINNSNISQCCQGKRKTVGGFIWRYAE